ncbi:MAG: NAD-dependent epimerase/dehydratase family protein [Candidatus Hodarchaeales archaeon]
MTQKNILITGACGFVGRNLLKNLFQKGYSIWIIDDLSIGQHPELWLPLEYSKHLGDDKSITYEYANQSIVFYKEDVIPFFYNQILGIREIPSLPSFFDEIYHLASIVGGRVLIDGDPIKIATDLAIDACFFLWVTRNPEIVGRILYASSSAAYPIHLQTKKNFVALKEDFIQFNENLGMPDMTYGWSKLTGEYLAQLTAELYKIPVACVRPFSGYGEDQDLTYPIPAIGDRFARKEDPIEVWGTGNQKRDFIYINDAVEVMQIILQNVSDGRGINIGSGNAYSFKKVIKIYSEIAGYSPEIIQLLEKPIGVQIRFSDISEMKKITNWEPKVSLHEGLTRVLRYRQKLLK